MTIKNGWFDQASVSIIKRKLMKIYPSKPSEIIKNLLRALDGPENEKVKLKNH